MNRQQRRRQQRLSSIVSDLGMNTISQIGFFYKGAGITLTDTKKIKELLPIFDAAIPSYKMAIDKDAEEVNHLLAQNDFVIENYLDKNIQPQNNDGVIFMMNVYILTRLGIIVDDNMNGLQYAYTR
jgi:hypothetical protein